MELFKCTRRSEPSKCYPIKNQPISYINIYYMYIFNIYYIFIFIVRDLYKKLPYMLVELRTRSVIGRIKANGISSLK